MISDLCSLHIRFCMFPIVALVYNKRALFQVGIQEVKRDVTHSL